MKFQSVNEVNQFSFDDCQMGNVVFAPDVVYFEAESLIVKPRNSQNEQGRESYAGTTLVRLEKGKLVSGFLEGYKRYDANDRLIDEAPDKPMETEEIKKYLTSCEGVYLYEMDHRPQEGLCELALETLEDDEDGVPKSYRFLFSCEKVIMGWDFYMNGVQR